jgi:hypothetical protein
MNAGGALLPNEDRATGAPADIEHWLGVYTKVVSAFRQRGYVHDGFESRFVFWQKLHRGECSSLRSSADADRPLRCPFSPLGLDSAIILNCPGFDAHRVTFSQLVGDGSVSGTSCRHIQVLPTDLGFAAFCAQPDARAARGGNEPSTNADPLETAAHHAA